MKKLILLLSIILTAQFLYSQSDTIIDEFDGPLDTTKIYGDNYIAMDVPNTAIVSIEDGKLRSDYDWSRPTWYPRAVWYHFDEYIDMSERSILEVKFMIEDEFNDSIDVQFDLYGDGIEPIDDTIRKVMETNGNSWEMRVKKGVWYTRESDFIADNRFFTTWWHGVVDSVRMDSSRIKGFEAFTNYGNDERKNQPGTLWIEYIKLKDNDTGVSKYLMGGKNAFGLAIYPTPASRQLFLSSEKTVKRIDIYKVTGQRILLLDNLNIKKFELDVSGYPFGVYIMNVFDDKGNMVSDKFIKL